MAVVTLSSKGQIVIPRDIRRRLRLEEGAKVEIAVSGQTAVLRPLRGKPADWRRWEGTFAKRGLLKALAEEHAAEIAEDA
ncbi:MAG: AbrB/MazE/SpoVT family DNA-binding domain-containing protein [Armatimonadetes bacterium]|nr:AbrB/MazE/SpoVT family DNA-binding domain-containing protein [Armatimonadota bacterium]